MNLESAISAWRSLPGVESVLVGEEAMAAYATDASGIVRNIPAAIRVSNAAAIPEVMRISLTSKVPIYPISTGKNWGYGTALPAKDGCVVLDLGDLKKILHFDAELGVVTVEPGVTQGMLADFLAQGGHEFLVPNTGAGPQCSLVGNALERGYGVTPMVDHFGAVTDIEAVLPDGSSYRTALSEVGGEDLARLFKWGIGPYSVGLFTQSGLGVVTRMSIILARRPESVKVCLFSLKDDALLEPAIGRIRNILAKLPGTVGAINLMNQHRVLAMSAPFPKDRLGPDGLIPQSVIEEMGRQYQIFPWTGFGTLYGASGVVAAAQRVIRRELSGIASRLLFLSPSQAKLLANITAVLPGQAGRRLASTVATLAKSLELVNGRPNETALPLCYWRNPNPPTGAWLDPSRDGCGLIWYAPLVPMRPAGVRAYVDMVKKIAIKHGVEPLITFTSISDKLFDSTVPLIFERDKPDAVTAATRCYEDLLHTGRASGWFPYRVGVNTMQTLAGLQSESKQFHQRLRAAFDPSDLMAPGRYR